MTAGFLLSAVLNGGQNISAIPGFCQHRRFKKSNCRRCLEICPENAISLEPCPTITSGCTDCGLCLNACPTEVFRHEFHTDRYLLNQARALLAKYRHHPQVEKKRLFIHCHQAEKRSDNSLALPCLGRITANIILGGVLAGFEEVNLTKGICFQCRYQKGEELLANSMAVSRVLLEGMGLGKFTINTEQKEKNKEASLGRREIFSKISDKVKAKAAAFLYHREKAMRDKLIQSPEIKTGRRCLPQRELLCELLDQNRPNNAKVVKYSPEFPWGKIKIERNRCSACGTCAALCPTAAISKKIKDGYQLLYFNSSLCTNCSLCQAACPQRAIDFEDAFALADIIAEEATVVAAIQLSTCFICGETITSPQNDLCPTCRKRQTRPMYAKV